MVELWRVNTSIFPQQYMLSVDLNCYSAPQVRLRDVGQPRGLWELLRNANAAHQEISKHVENLPSGLIKLLYYPSAYADLKLKLNTLVPE